MPFGCENSRWSRRCPWTALASLLLLFGVAVTALGEPPEPPKDRQGRSLTPSTVPNEYTLQRNRVILILTSNGQIGATRGSVAGGGFWIATSNQYIFSSGPNIGATLPATGDTVVAIGGPFSQFPEGSGAVGIPGLDVYWSSADPADAASFPEVCTVDEFRVSQFPSLAPFLGLPFPGFADETVCVAVSDLTGPACGVCEGTRVGVDIVETMFAFGVPSVQDFVFVAFRVFNRTDFINASNAPAQPAGPYDLENTIVAIAIDPDVGDSGDDQIGFLPDVQTMVFWDSDFTEPQFQGSPGFGGITYLKTPVDPVTGEEVGLREFTVFTNGAPRPDPNTKEEWYQLMTGDPSEAVLSVSPQDVRGMASSGPFVLPQGEFVEIYAAYFFANVSGSPPAQLLAEPYKDLRTGEIDPNANDSAALDGFKTVQQTAQAVFDAGFVVPTAPPKPEIELIPGEGQVTITWSADPVESVNPFAKVARDPFARLADGSIDPAAPPVLGQDGLPIILDADQVIFVPDRDQGGTTGFVTAAEAGLSGRSVTNPAFDADFTVQDFQGFNVYRSRTGLLDDSELIAQFDLADGIAAGTFCTSATAVFDKDDGGFETAICTSQEAFAIGGDTELSFAVIDRGGSFPTPSVGPGLINGIPISYTVTSFAVNTGQSPVDLPVREAFDVLVPPAAPLVLEAGLAPMQQATPRSNSSALQGGLVSGVDLLGGDGQPLSGFEGPIAVDADGNLTGERIPPAKDWSVDVTPIHPELLPANFQMVFHFDSIPMAPDLFGPFLPWEPCNIGLGLNIAGGLGCGDLRAREVFFRLTDGGGNVLDIQTGPGEVGPAQGSRQTGFLAFGGTTLWQSPVFAVVPDGASEPAFQAVFSTTINARGNQCSVNDTCLITTSDGVTTPSSVKAVAAEPGLYGQVRVADVEIVWSNQGGALALSSIRDVSNNVDLQFVDTFGTERGWGFARATRLRAAEADVARQFGAAETDDGRFLWPDPLSAIILHPDIACLTCGISFAPATQTDAMWLDLPVEPNVEQIFAQAGAINNFAYVPEASARHPGVFAETAAVARTPDGDPFIRLYVSGHLLNITLNSLPSDGETWLLRLAPANAGSESRPLVPGMALRVDLPGATNELANADLSEIRVVPNPFIAANEVTRGNGLQRILFTNLPPQATIRIYTISGNLVRVLEHADGSGTEAWDVRTRFDLLVASGNYYFHVTTSDGRTHLGRFAVVN
ncbi:MAG: T9SS type A sorting domain-containing protein [Gemmatimonadota bacterium]